MIALGFTVTAYGEPAPPVFEGCAPPPSDLVAWWSFDHSAGAAVAVDAVGPHSGQVTGDRAFGTGKLGNSLGFDGVDDHVEVGDSNLLDFGASPGGDFSVDFWIRTTQTDLGTLLDKRGIPSAVGWQVFLFDGSIGLQLADLDDGHYNFLGPTVNDGQWHFVAITVDRDDPQGGVFYLDGAPVGGTFKPTRRSGSLSNDAALQIGRSTFFSPGSPFNPGRHFSGSLDEIEIFRRALTADEVALLYELGASQLGKCTFELQVPWDTSYCLGTPSRVDLTLCNHSTSADAFDLDLGPLPAGTQAHPLYDCELDGPTSFALPPEVPQPIVVPAGSCLTVPVEVGGLVPPEQLTRGIACFQTRATSVLTGDTIGRPGSLFFTGSVCCDRGNPQRTSVPLEGGGTVEFTATNVTAEPRPFEYEISVVGPAMEPDTDAVGLDGAEPGAPVTGEVTIGAGETVAIPVQVDFERFTGLGFYEILLADRSQPAPNVLVSQAVRPAAGGCAASGLALCLNQQRFQVDVAWTDFQGKIGSGTAVPLTSDTGYFWFFRDTNVELVVKVLDGRPINGNFWVFYGALSNVGYALTVTDTATGDSKTYLNPSGQFASVGDTGAFPQNGSAAATAPRHRVVAAADLGATAPLGRDLFAFAGAAAAVTGAANGPCAEDAGDLCLNGDRFRVEVKWTDFQGNMGQGTAEPLTTDTGYFWFFRDTNVELIVKVLDGRPINGNWWVFYGALSNVEYEMTVTDTLTGATRSYANPAGTFASRGDTGAFPAQ